MIITEQIREAIMALAIPSAAPDVADVVCGQPGDSNRQTCLPGNQQIR